VLGDVLDLEQQPRHLPERHLRHGAVQNAIDAPGSRPGQFALHDTFAAQVGALEQNSQGLGAARQLREAPAERLIGPRPSKV